MYIFHFLPRLSLNHMYYSSLTSQTQYSGIQPKLNQVPVTSGPLELME